MHTEKFAAGELVFFDRLKSWGYLPQTVYDIGASDCSWSGAMLEVFPDAEFHLFDPLADRFPAYMAKRAAILSAHPNLHFHSIALGNTTGQTKFYRAKDGYSSSAHPMSSAQADEIEVESWRLDEYAVARKLPLPNLLKLDVQGGEAMVLEGAGDLVVGADVIFMETWLNRGYGPSTPLLTEFIEALRPLQFVLVDVCGPYYGDYRELTSVDAFFVSARLMDRIREASSGWRW